MSSKIAAFQWWETYLALEPELKLMADQIGRLFQAPVDDDDSHHAIGTSCVGSSEVSTFRSLKVVVSFLTDVSMQAIILGTLAMKKVHTIYWTAREIPLITHVEVAK